MNLEVTVIRNGEEKKLDLIAEFQVTEGNNVNDYILLTENEIVEENLIKLWTAKVEGDKLLRIESETSWEAIKNFMRSVSAIANINVNFVNNVSDKTLIIEEKKLRILAVKEEVLKLFKTKYGEYYRKVEKELKDKKREEENNKIIIPILENQNSEVKESAEEVTTETITETPVENEVQEEVNENVIDDSVVVETKDELAEEENQSTITAEEVSVNETEENDEPMIETPIEEPMAETPVDQSVESEEDETPIIEPTAAKETTIKEEIKEEQAVETSTESKEDELKSVLKTDVVNAIDNFILKI